MRRVEIKTVRQIPDNLFDGYLEYLKSYLPENLVKELKEKGKCGFTTYDEGLEQRTEYRVFTD